jgi:LacI family transcriptional regulator
LRRFQKATISDVAEKAGVSITTVSRFVSGRENVCSADTAERIRTAIADLHYTPSSLVSSVGRRATRTLGVCMYSSLDPGVLYGGSFFERLWRGIVAEANQQDYSLLHYPASVLNGKNTDPFLDGRVDGLLYHPPTPVRDPEGRQEGRLERLAAAGMPTVAITRSLGLPDGCGSAYVDESGTATLALAHLWERGHRRIAHIAGPTGPGDNIGTGRLEAYRAWMRERGVYDPALEGQAHSWRAETCVAEIVAGWASLPVRPTAVFAGNDTLALAVIAAAQALGWNLPNALSVVGVDNTPDAAVAGLTTVDPPIEDVGRASVRALLNILHAAPLPSCRIAVPVTQLVSRESVVSVSLP